MSIVILREIRYNGTVRHKGVFSQPADCEENMRDKVRKIKGLCVLGILMIILAGCKKDDSLTDISLDAKYRCYISTKSELLYCTGVVKERFRTEDLNILKFRIENGFYNVYEGRRMTKRA